ncbi:KIN17-like protein [Tanacetum coccineum]|uniref:KIN17-like protein n=1 Tax=Tanacetum coccineum TaxID=301880 RepID=A0ABQ4YSG7_9ASTR
MRQIERAEEKLAVVDKSLDYEEKKYLMRDKKGSDEKRIKLSIAKNVGKEKGEGNASGKKFVFDEVDDVKVGKSKHKLRVDQEELETVIPQIGGVVRVVNGACRGSNARLLGVNTVKFCARVQIEKRVYDGRVIQAIEYYVLNKRRYSSSRNHSDKGKINIEVKDHAADFCASNWWYCGKWTMPNTHHQSSYYYWQEMQ